MLSSEVVHGIKALGLCSLLATSDVLSGWRFSKPYSMGYVLRVKGAAFIIRHNLNPKPKTVSNEMNHVRSELTIIPRVFLWGSISGLGKGCLERRG